MTRLPAPSKEAIDVILQYAPHAPKGRSAKAVTYSLQRFIEAVYATDFMLPFDWMSEFSADSLSPDNRAALATADASQLRKLLIAHLRLDRFLEGHLQKLLRSGYLDQLLARLKAVRGTMT